MSKVRARPPSKAKSRKRSSTAMWSVTALAHQTVEPPVALTEALDALSSSWALAFNRKSRPLRFPTASRVVDLLQPVVTRADFSARISSLADVLKSFVVDDDLVSDPGHNDLKAHMTLGWILDVVKHRLPDAHDDQIVAAIRNLRAINGLRTGEQHADTAMAAALAIGLVWPASNWTDAWDHVRGVAVASLRAIRLALDSTA